MTVLDEIEDLVHAYGEEKNPAERATLMEMVRDTWNKEHKWCSWSLDEQSSTYETDCNNSFVFIDNDLAANKFKFCCWCGERINDPTNKLDEST